MNDDQLRELCRREADDFIDRYCVPTTPHARAFLMDRLMGKYEDGLLDGVGRGPSRTRMAARQLAAEGGAP